MVRPSGDQHEVFLAGDTTDEGPEDQQAVVVEVGGGLRTYTVGGRDLLDGYVEQAMADGGRGQVLAPWPNRIQDGTYSFDGRDHQLPVTEVARGNAIHGLVRWSSWRLFEQEPFSSIGVEHLLHPQPGYPFTLRLQVRYRLWTDGLTVATTATNEGDQGCPYGTGAHPYLRLGDALVDDLVLTSPAGQVLVSDERAIPVSRQPVDGTPYDFRAPRPIGDLTLDHAFTDLARNSDGRACVTLSDPASGHAVELWMDEGYGHLMLFSGDTLAADRRRRSLAIEPMTCPPNAFRTCEDVIRLEPGASVTTTWGLRELEQP